MANQSHKLKRRKNELTCCILNDAVNHRRNGSIQPCTAFVAPSTSRLELNRTPKCCLSLFENLAACLSPFSLRRFLASAVLHRFPTTPGASSMLLRYLRAHNNKIPEELNSTPDQNTLHDQEDEPTNLDGLCMKPEETPPETELLQRNSTSLPILG
ncbi:hypothetical protein F2Q69_00049320 [Brassica cretica]|uniref:Uncharacterized protein n=1 Tax=Brassica cretica TaxID=69181 RepID=A0A8S9Q1F0_BRACR|nr:hypothetical protein F2Q69_00049320 [Brassica cretica]